MKEQTSLCRPGVTISSADLAALWRGALLTFAAAA
jgi:hypothetical protein